MLCLVAVLASLFPAVASAAPGSAPLPIPPTEENIDLPQGLTPYHDVAPTINDIVARSDRVRAEVVGQSAGGRDLYLVVVAEPEVFEDLETYQAFRWLMVNRPADAQRLAPRLDDFKVPVFVNGSIHGNEWEGVDASLDTIERLAFGEDAATRAVLDNAIVLFNVVQNPDGRVLGTRRNANGFDINRDFITNSQPESRITRDLILEWLPMTFLDLHGYVTDMLIEPTTPPHNPNYEYDLYIKWALGQANAMEAELAAETEFDDAVIPFRDWEVGDWDDWPPIFAPMYAMYHGAYGHTLEAPVRVNGSAVDDPPDVRAANAAKNRAAHNAVVWGMLGYVAENRQEMVLDQIEVFRRGAAAAQPVPIDPGFVPGYGEEDQYWKLATYPQAYVIPSGERQRSESAAADLVGFLLEHGVVVRQASEPFALGGTTYRRGSYVVPMAQARRGLANTILERGYDITAMTPQMYDISGWSHSLLWGATVDRIEEGELPPAAPIDAAAPAQGSLPRGEAAAYALAVDDQVDIVAANELLGTGLVLGRAPDGRLVVDASGRRTLAGLAYDGVVFDRLESVPDDLAHLDTVEIGGAIGQDEAYVLTELGFEVDEVSADKLNADPAALNKYEVLLVSSGLAVEDLDADARAALDAWLAAGGGLVTRGSDGAAFNEELDLLDVEFQHGPACSTANGVVEVVNDPAAPATTFASEDATAFVYGPVWFTNLGDGVTVDQQLSEEDFFVAGHWLGDTEPGAPECEDSQANSGQGAAAGAPVVVSGVADEGAPTILFGTDPLFRDHPKGLYTEVANALYWTASAG